MPALSLAKANSICIRNIAIRNAIITENKLKEQKKNKKVIIVHKRKTK